MAEKKQSKPRSNAVTHDKIEDILYYAHVEGLTDTKIGELLDRDNTTIGKIRQKAEKEYLVKIINIPSAKKTEKQLEKLLGIDKAIVVSRGHGKNSEHLGYAAAIYLCDLIGDKFKSKNTINIGVSCGSSIRITCKRLVERLHDHNISLSGKTINIYPSALIGGNKFAMITPSFVASQLANKLLSLPSELRPSVNCYRSTIPASFYSNEMSEEERSVIKKYCGYESILPDPINTLDIILTGIGRVDDDEFTQACELSGIKYQIEKGAAENMPEVNFSPIEYNEVIGQSKGEIEGIHFEQMCQMKEMEGKYVIALIGGKEKAAIAKTAFKKPYFNILFTDTHVVRPWLQTEKK